MDTKAIMNVVVLCIMVPIAIIVIQSVVASFNFTGDFATVLTLIFGSVVGILLGVGVLKKIADSMGK